MAKKLNLNKQSKWTILPEAGDGDRTPIKGTKEQYQAYQDSLDVYNSYLDTQKDLESHGYIPTPRIKTNPLFGDAPKYLDSNYTTPLGHQSSEYYKKKFKEGDSRTYKQIDENKFSIQDIDNEMVNTKLKPQLFNSKINPKGRIMYQAPEQFVGKAPDNYYFDSWYNEHYPLKQDIRSVFNYENAKPVQPIIYQSEVRNEITNRTEPLPTSTQSDEFYTDSDGRRIRTFHNRQTGNRDWEYVKEQPINIQSAKPDLLQGNGNIEFNPIPFTPGSYFTRPLQQGEKFQKYDQQGKEIPQIEYFDKKTGKKLGNGGKVSNKKKYGGRIRWQTTPKAGDGYKWSTTIPKNQEVVNTEKYDYQGFDNGNIDNYLKGVQLLGDVVSFINPILGRGISAAGDFNDVIKHPREIKNYITPFIPMANKAGLPAKLASKVGRFNGALNMGTLATDIPEEKKNGGKVLSWKIID